MKKDSGQKSREQTKSDIGEWSGSGFETGGNTGRRPSQFVKGIGYNETPSVTSYSLSLR